MNRIISKLHDLFRSLNDSRLYAAGKTVDKMLGESVKSQCREHEKVKERKWGEK